MHGTPMVTVGTPMVKVFIFCITVHRVHSTDEDGYIYTHLIPLAVDSIEQAHGNRFDREIYLSRDLLEFVPRHQWPDIQLPVPQVVPQPQPPVPSVNEEVLKGLQTTHDASVNMPCTQGIDACKVKKREMLHPSWHISGPKMSSVLIVIEFVKHPRS